MVQFNFFAKYNCQTQLTKTHFAFEWARGENLIVNNDVKNIHVVDDDNGINPQHIDPVIDSVLSQGFQCWIVEVTSGIKNISNTKMYPLNYRTTT